MAIDDESSPSTIFKYATPDLQSRILSGPRGAVFKCSHPRDFDDPYELFLSIERDEEPELLAFYADVIGDIPQRPTTCFSRSPSIIPMWAHYGQSGQGFVVEIDQAVLSSIYPESGFGDVDYREEADPGLNDLLRHAFTTCKPRHTFMLRRAVMSAAYYTKAACWSHEQEKRMVVREEDVRSDEGLLLLDVPKDAVVRLIAGPSINAEAQTSLNAYADLLACELWQLRIGRTSSDPYFIDQAGRARCFDGRAFVPVNSRCGECGEPIKEDEDRCSMCRITEAHRTAAAHSNPYRLLHHTGLLSGYLRDMNEIAASGRKRR